MEAAPSLAAAGRRFKARFADLADAPSLALGFRASLSAAGRLSDFHQRAQGGAR